MPSPPGPSPIDADLLATLERAFAHHAGGDDNIDAAELQKALGLKSEYLTRRVLSTFDRNGDGVISKDEFIGGVRALVFGSDKEKLEFVFRLHDDNGDGFLDQNELYRMIAISLAESDVAERMTQPPSELARVLLAAADADHDGRVSFAEFEAVVRRRPDLLRRLTRDEAIWIAPNEELLLKLDRAKGGLILEPGWVRRFVENDLPQVVVLVLWMLANVGVFTGALHLGRAHETSEPAMKIGYALGNCIDLDGGLILIPVMRRLLTRVRATWLGRFLPVDDAITFHKVVGHTLFALAVTHSAAFVLAYANGHMKNGAFRLFETARGFTGTALLAVFALMWVCSLGFVRRSKRFELFYFTHLLYAVWIAIAIAHAPRFAMWAVVPLVGLTIEQVLRLLRRRPPSRVLSTWPLRSGVTRLELERPKGFAFSAGDYVFLRIPAIARHEWHPFTISSAPEADTLSFHVRSLGNWTAALRRTVEERKDGAGGELLAYVDGPYGSPSAHIFRSRFAVLIGAGIGVTPFASVLESAVLRANDAPQAGRRPEGALQPEVPPQAGRRPEGALQKVHFFWLNRDQYSFEWFRGLLSRLEDADTRGVLDIHLCMTGARTGVTAFGLELAREMMAASGRSDLVTGLRSQTHLGPADWETLLGRIAELHRPATVDVFFCGPHGLGKKLAPLCRRLGMTFREERF